jgi:hypothetical protein
MKDLEIVWNWIPLPDGNSIIGFEDNLSTRTVIKQVSLFLGTTINTDTFNEMIFPWIIGTRNGGNEYVLVEHRTDLNDPLNPTKLLNIAIRDLVSHTYVADYFTTKHSYWGSIVMNDDGYYYAVVTHDSSTSKNNIDFFDLVTGVWYSGANFVQNYTSSIRMITAGPGTDRFVTISNDRMSLDHTIFQPGVVTSANYYTVGEAHYGFIDVDVDIDHSHVAASYETTDGKVHIAVWSAFN